MKNIKLYLGDCLEVLKKLNNESINMCITSPPYWALRDYGVKGQLGQEKTFQEYIIKLCNVFDEVKRVLTKDGTCWVNLGDTYSGSKIGNTEKYKNPNVVSNSFIKLKGTLPSKCLCQIPSRFAIEMTNQGWILRNEIIWHKPNTMPESVKDRFTVDFEKLFFFVKNKKYQFEQQLEPFLTSVGKLRDKNLEKYKNMPNQFSKGKRTFYGEKGRNKRTVWKIATKLFKEAHFAVFPEQLIEIPIKAGCPESGTILDPFCGSGTTGCVAKKLNRKFIGIELSEEYMKIAMERIKGINNER